MQPLNLYDYEELAQARLAQPIWDYYQGGSDDEITLRANREAFTRLRLRPRVLTGTSSCDLRTAVLGSEISMPVIIAPTAGHGMAHPDGECATMRGAGAAHTGMIASHDSTYSLEEIAQVATGPHWFQLYIYTFQEAQQVIKRAEAAGYQALVLTVDAPILGRRERDMRNDMLNFQRVYYPKACTGNATHIIAGSSNASEQAAYEGDHLTWDIITWLQQRTSLPIIVKGILTAEDAELAIAHHVAGIVVSNHGGRQLDSVLPSIEALPEIVAAVAGRCEIYLDGGIRRGSDILKALALGAHAVLLGRPILWGLATAGADGVQQVLEILREELRIAMILAGCSKVSNISRDLVA
jgi:isopentenyl diphosphate isomerase/L-lactate dehydrogenase-like FMN-dependent dehydrogenase